MQSTERRPFPHRRGLIIVTTLATAYMASHFFRASNVTIGLDLMRDLAIGPEALGALTGAAAPPMPKMIPAASLDHVVGAQAATTVIPFSTEISDIAGKNDDIVVRIFYPAFSVVGSGVHIRSFDDRRAKGARLLYRSVKPAQLEPEQNAKTAGRCGGVAKVRMAMNVPGVKLENYFAIFHNLLVFIPAVTALATKQLLVPTAAALHISHGDQRLSFHTVTLLPTAPGIKLTPTSA